MFLCFSVLFQNADLTVVGEKFRIFVDLVAELFLLGENSRSMPLCGYC